MNVRKIVVAAGLIAAAAGAQAIDIPLTGGGAGTGGGQRIGYVDMERIFQVFPQTKFAKEDYAERLEKMRADLRAKEDDLRAIKARIGVLESAFNELNQNAAPGGAPAPDAETQAALDAVRSEPAALGELKAELEAKQLDLEEARARASADLQAFERQQSQLILGKIYQALKELADEQQINLVVDKSSILFGSAEIDLTDDLQRRVRGF